MSYLFAGNLFQLRPDGLVSHGLNLKEFDNISPSKISALQNLPPNRNSDLLRRSGEFGRRTLRHNRWVGGGRWPVLERRKNCWNTNELILSLKKYQSRNQITSIRYFVLSWKKDKKTNIHIYNSSMGSKLSINKKCLFVVWINIKKCQSKYFITWAVKLFLCLNLE